MTPEERAAVRANARKLVPGAPPLTDRQVDVLRALLPPAVIDNAASAQAAGGTR